MGLFKRGEDKTLLTASVLLRIQALVTAASGVARIPKSQEGSKSGSGYAQALFNKTPEKPQLKVLALKRSETETTVTVGIETPNGQMVEEFTTKGVLTEHNALATGASIAKVLKDPSAASSVGRELIALTQEPDGSQRAFRLGPSNRLQIESGRGD